MSGSRWTGLAFAALVGGGVLFMAMLAVDALRTPGPSAAAAAADPSRTAPAPPTAKPSRESPGLTEEEIRRAGLSLREAMYYDKLPNREVQCRLCPSFCRLKDGQRGACRARANLGGTLRSLVYGRLVAVNNDPIEKKPLNHFLPGTRTFSIATAGCNLGCVFCQNWEISQAFPEKARFMEASPEQVVAAARREGCESIAYTYTEPTVFYEFMLDTCRLARKEGLKNLWITCGYINPEPLAELCAVMDAANIDLKGFREEFYREYCRAALRPVLDTLQAARAQGVWVEVTNLVIPGANDSPEDLRALCVWHLEHLGADTPLHFSRFFPRYRLLDRPMTPPATLIRAYETARAVGLHHVYVGNIAAETGCNTFCPKCGAVCIARQGYAILENRLKDGCCPQCGEKLAGVWTAPHP